jgi:hypothetical protein
MAGNEIRQECRGKSRQRRIVLPAARAVSSQQRAKRCARPQQISAASCDCLLDVSRTVEVWSNAFLARHPSDSVVAVSYEDLFFVTARISLDASMSARALSVTARISLHDDSTRAGKHDSYNTARISLARR